MKSICFICCSIFVVASAVPTSWQSVQVDRHVKNNDVESSIKITLIKADNNGINGISGNVNSNVGGIDSITNQFDQISNKIDELFINNKIDTPLAVAADKNKNCDEIKQLKTDSQTEFIFQDPIDVSCVEEVARTSKTGSKAVVVLGLDEIKSNVLYLDLLMSRKELVLDKSYDLPSDLIKKYTDHRVYVAAQNLTAKLVSSVKMGVYDKAVSISKSLEEQNNGKFIKNAVNDLIENGNKNLMSFAYKLWENNSRIIVKNYFPKSIYLVLNHDEVVLVYKKDYGRVRLSTNFTQQDLDRDVFTECTQENATDFYWNFVPIWTKNKVSFKIWNSHYEKYLKIQQQPEQDGSRVPWGGVNEWYIGGRFIWNLIPVETNSPQDLMFCFINIEHNQALTSSDCSTNKSQVLAKSRECSEEHAWYIADKDFVPKI